MNVRTQLSLLAIFLMAPCGGRKGSELRGETIAPDKTLFENAMKLLDKKHFIKSHHSFQTLINNYPDSEYTPASFLSIAGSYYEEGGKQNLLQAEAQYKDFIIFYPTHDLSPRAKELIREVQEILSE